MVGGFDLMEVIKDRYLDVLIFKPTIYNDERGFFLETCRKSYLDEYNIPPLIQHNHSRSKRGVLRGLHYQLNPLQGKLVRCSNGRIFDIAVDIRKSSSTFGKYFYRYLDDISHEQIWIPPGFAHGFYVISDYADVCYQSSDCTIILNLSMEFYGMIKNLILIGLFLKMIIKL